MWSGHRCEEAEQCRSPALGDREGGVRKGGLILVGCGDEERTPMLGLEEKGGATAVSRGGGGTLGRN
jgi:hypothetical protein